MALATTERTYDRYTFEYRKDDIFVYGWSTYPPGSVLEGQPMKCFIEVLGADDPQAHRAALEARYPGITPGSRFTDPQVNLHHLPSEDDPVPGGMYPDDWED